MRNNPGSQCDGKEVSKKHDGIRASGAMSRMIYVCKLSFSNRCCAMMLMMPIGEVGNPSVWQRIEQVESHLAENNGSCSTPCGNSPSRKRNSNRCGQGS
jgi:hypothetical protein